MKLQNNTILVTGGASGIGFELATRLLEMGNQVIITGRNQNRLDEAKKKLKRVHTIQHDVSNAESITSLYITVKEQFPTLNILINNAGIMRKINLHDATRSLEDLSLEIETNLTGTVRMNQQFLPLLKSQKNAAIVNVSSGLAFVPFPISPIYGATKAGVHSYTRSLRVQLKNTSVNVFELAPPPVNTPLLNNFEASDAKGVPVMSVADLAKIAIKGIERDRFEIRPGASNLLKIINRLSPALGLKMMSGSVNRMIAPIK
ncbi:SDR family NAD(P)-dependent oxidoreductase [Alkalicoccobacillus porphyridii]|uniref:SDR family NAD(P)-dependent oxidoreductase n=2 Tax=Alkalicoccobacillus porphyridii TaxID=2597270 RepID=A0A554A2Q8_9BACI|nr:SDR family NAD(P)-dependent oxidoreductase [Alkalicoccobacillus porphyridii]